jgi:hypothetical protein
VLFEGAGDADDFEYIFSEFELEKVRRGPWTLTAQGSPPVLLPSPRRASSCSLTLPPREQVVEATPGEAPAAAAAAGGGADASGPVDERRVTATLALSPGGGGAGAPTQAAVLDLLGEAVLQHEAFAGGEGGVEVRFTPLGVSLVGTWGAVVRAAGVATDALMRGGASSAVVTLTMVVS